MMKTIQRVFTAAILAAWAACLLACAGSRIPGAPSPPWPVTYSGVGIPVVDSGHRVVSYRQEEGALGYHEFHIFTFLSESRCRFFYDDASRRTDGRWVSTEVGRPRHYGCRYLVSGGEVELWWKTDNWGWKWLPDRHRLILEIRDGYLLDPKTGLKYFPSRRE